MKRILLYAIVLCSMLACAVGCGDASPTEPNAVDGSHITVDLPGGAEMDFVWIEPGTFMMGSPPTEVGRGAEEGP